MQDRSKFLKALDAFGFVTAVLLVLAWVYGLQVRSWYRAREMGKSHPVVFLAPRPLPSTNAALEKGLTLTEFGYQWDVPWAKVDTHKTGSSIAVYLFSGGVGLSFWNPAEITTTVQTMKNAVQDANHRFINFLGVQTEYDLLNSEMNITPGNISPFMRKQDAFRQGVLLSLKQIELQTKVSAIYSFESKGLRGFQFGDPARDRILEIKSFNADDEEFRFRFAVERGSNVKLDQAEINKVVQSLRAASVSAPRPSAAAH
jgi:hypothetical protein